MSSERRVKPVVSYPREAVVDRSQLAAGLGVGVRTAERQGFYDLPSTMLGGKQVWVWGQVLDVLMERAA